MIVIYCATRVQNRHKSACPGLEKFKKDWRHLLVNYYSYHYGKWQLDYRSFKLTSENKNEFLSCRCLDLSAEGFLLVCYLCLLYTSCKVLTKKLGLSYECET